MHGFVHSCMDRRMVPRVDFTTLMKADMQISIKDNSLERC